MDNIFFTVIFHFWPDIVVLCVFHLCQSVYRKVVELGLKVRYNKDEDFSSSSRCLWHFLIRSFSVLYTFLILHFCFRRFSFRPSSWPFVMEPPQFYAAILIIAFLMYFLLIEKAAVKAAVKSHTINIADSSKCHKYEFRYELWKSLKLKTIILKQVKGKNVFVSKLWVSVSRFFMTARNEFRYGYEKAWNWNP